MITESEQLKRYSACHRVWQGIPGIARTRRGRILISFYSGRTAETYGNYVVVLKSDNGRDFGEPIAAVEKSGAYRCFDPVLWMDPLERLWLIWNVMLGEQVFASVCEQPDAPRLKWSREFLIGRGVMMNQPTVLSTGEWLFPVAVWRENIYCEMRKPGLIAGEQTGAFVYKTSDHGKTFIRMGCAELKSRSFDEHMVVELKNGVLKMYVRLKNGIGESDSYDRGKSWSCGQISGIQSPSSRFLIRRLASGRVLLINHYQFSGRDHLTALLSEDEGRSFPYHLCLDERSDVSYPGAVEGNDGFLYITYDRERGCFRKSLNETYGCAREILLARIREDEILNGALTHEGSFLKHVVSRLGKLSPVDADPYTETLPDDRSFAELLIRNGDVNPLETIFERYPINCTNAVSFNYQKLDALISRFRETDSRDTELLAGIISLIRHAPRQTEDVYPVVETVKRIIEAHLPQSDPISELARSMNMSINYLSHLFKSVTGTTLTDYRNELRLTRAKQMLIGTNNRVGTIAHEVGFCSAAYFAEAFQNSENLSPTAFRKLHRQGIGESGNRSATAFLSQDCDRL